MDLTVYVYTLLAIFRPVSYIVTSRPLEAVLIGFVLLCQLFKFYCRMTFGVCKSDQDMTEKTVLITGATAGIGKATAEDMAKRNARVILACRNIEKAKRVADEIISSTGNKNVIVKHLDLASLRSVRKCAEDILNTEEKLHVLINNAGIYSSDKPTTKDGQETVLQSNHLGHFLLTLLLLDLLKESSPSRIINVSSMAYKLGKLDFDDMEGIKLRRFEKYARSKYANVLFTIELASRLENSGVTVNALHPGFVKTDIFKSPSSWFQTLSTILQFMLAIKSSKEGAQTTIYLAVHPEAEKVTGKYFCDCKEEKIVPKLLDMKLAEKLFEVSEKMVGIAK